MLIKLFLAAFLLAFASSTSYYTTFGERQSAITLSVPKVYDINLDLSYEEQWRPIITDFEQDIKNFINELGVSSKIPLHLIDYLDYPLIELYDKKFAEEVKALSNLISLSFTEILLINFMYDLTAQCTSILIQDSDNKIYHARNLDFDYTPTLSKLVFHGRYFKNGELLYEAISLAGYTGLITGIKPNAYSFSINQYILTNNGTIWDEIADIILDIGQSFRGKLSPPIVARNAFETIETYDEFVQYMESTETISRVFYIIGGTQPGQGVIITKFRDSVENVTSLNPEAGEWFVVQTNYIGDALDPSFDNRATAAKDWLNSIGRDQISKQLLFDNVMTVYPVFNNLTIHSTIMQASTGYFNTTIWGW